MLIWRVLSRDLDPGPRSRTFDRERTECPTQPSYQWRSSNSCRACMDCAGRRKARSAVRGRRYAIDSLGVGSRRALDRHLDHYAAAATYGIVGCSGGFDVAVRREPAAIYRALGGRSKLRLFRSLEGKCIDATGIGGRAVSDERLCPSGGVAQRGFP